MPDPRHDANGVTIYQGDCVDVLRSLPESSVHCCITSPPYWGLRDYGVDGQIGLEATPEEYVAKMVEVFREVRRVLRDDATLWLNLGDSWASKPAGTNGFRDGRANREERRSGGVPVGLKPKDLVGIPWRVALALQDDGWWLRQDIIWHKPSPMPESVTDRCTKAHEYLFLMTKSPRYYYDAEAVREPMLPQSRARAAYGYAESDRDQLGHSHHGKGYQRNDGSPVELNPAGRNRRSVWTIPSKPFAKAHFATFPPKLVEPCILAGTSERGCCPQCGASWRRVVERERVATRPGTNTKIKVPGGWDVAPGSHGTIHRKGRTEATYRDAAEIGNRDPQRHCTTATTTGWEPGCECGGLGAPYKPVPCTVLDPFAGSGTVGMVAQQYQHKAILIELSEEYVTMAAQRCELEQGVMAFETGGT